MSGQRGKLAGADESGGLLDGGVAAKDMIVSKWYSDKTWLAAPRYCVMENLRGDAAGLGLAGDESLPSLGALTDDVHGVAVAFC